MPKSMTFSGRYNAEGKPEGFSQDMRQLVGEAFAGCEVDIVFIKRRPRPSASLRGFFFAAVLPWFMEIMQDEEGWVLHPANKHDQKTARVRIFETFLRPYKIEQAPKGDGHLIKLPSFADLDDEDLIYLIRRLEIHCAENYGRSLPSNSEEEYRQFHASY